MLLLGLDFETTWTTPVDPKKCRAVEAGAVLYDTEKKIPVALYSELIWGMDYPVNEITEELTELTGIDLATLEQWGQTPQKVFGELTALMFEADHIVAHNGTGFDKPLYLAEMGRINHEPSDKPWIDTRNDISFPKKIKSRALDALGPAHGFLNPFAHRALFDVLTMLKVLGHYDLDEVIALSKSPTLTIRADVSMQNKDLAKERGYHWDSGNKIWHKMIKECHLETEMAASKFKVIVMQGAV